MKLGTYLAHMALLQEMEYFFEFGLLLPVLKRHLLPKLPSTVLKANYYVISGNFICLSFQIFIFHKKDVGSY